MPVSRGYMRAQYPLLMAPEPPPPPGDRHLAQKAQAIPRAKGAEENFSFGYAGTGGREDPCNPRTPHPGDRHLATVSPPPPSTLVDRHALRGEIARGGWVFTWRVLVESV